MPMFAPPRAALPVRAPVWTDPAYTEPAPLGLIRPEGPFSAASPRHPGLPRTARRAARPPDRPAWSARPGRRTHPCHLGGPSRTGTGMRATLRTTRSARPRPRPGSPDRVCSSRRRSRSTPAAATPPARPWQPATPRRVAGSGSLRHQPYPYFLTWWPPWPAMIAKLAGSAPVAARERTDRHTAVTPARLRPSWGVTPV